MTQKTYNQSELLHSITVFKDTVPLMRSNGIPLTPENYSLWYAYCSGDIQALNDAIEQNLRKGIEFTKQFNQQLYEEFIEPQGSEELYGFQNATKELIEKLLSELIQVGDGSKEYVSSMEDCEKRLLDNPDVAQLSEIVGQVIDKTKSINETNIGLVDSLKSMEDEIGELKSGVVALKQQANTDQLTKIANRRGFEESFSASLEKYQASGQAFSLLLIDIDRFKVFNDTHGHALGDKILTYVAGTLASGITELDTVARFGGEEFVVLINGADAAKGFEVAEKLRISVSQKKLKSNQAKQRLGNITVSIGVATMSGSDDMGSLLENADKAMYKAKESGRNQVCCH